MKTTDFVKQRDNPAIFNRFRWGKFYYRVRDVDTQAIFEFSVPIEDVEGVTLNKFENAITLMKWINKAISSGEMVPVTE